MDKWQRSFLGKLESARQHWVGRFDAVAEDHLTPVFEEFEAFTTANGFRVSAPECSDPARHFKFELTENGYVLLTFRLHGLERVAAFAEVVVPGTRPQETDPLAVHLATRPRAGSKSSFATRWTAS
jgi:hypothetical protein